MVQKVIKHARVATAYDLECMPYTEELLAEGTAERVSAQLQLQAFSSQIKDVTGFGLDDGFNAPNGCHWEGVQRQGEQRKLKHGVAYIVWAVLLPILQLSQHVR